MEVPDIDDRKRRKLDKRQAQNNDHIVRRTLKNQNIVHRSVEQIFSYYSYLLSITSLTSVALLSKSFHKKLYFYPEYNLVRFT